MITIKNIGGDVLGISQYEMKINGKHITFFRHDRRAGLSTCLKKASEAAGLKNYKMISEKNQEKNGGI